MKRLTGKRTLVAIIALTMILGFNLFMNVKNVTAAEPETAQFSVDTSIMENLALLKGKSVTLYLTSGQTITGVVNGVKGNLLHLGKISQKEFYDALVAIDRISAIEMKVR
ncbi:MAG: hypothetical protein ABSE08_15205 [Syntrophobacteraceae bacterium]|jgi:hypothetical protein